MNCDLAIRTDEFAQRTWALSGVDEFVLRTLPLAATEVAVWKPDWTVPGPAIVFESRKASLVAVDLSHDAIPVFVVRSGLPAQDCCDTDRVLEGAAGSNGYASLSVIHRFRPHVVPRPRLNETYPPRCARSTALGDPVALGGHLLDRLQPLGVLVHMGAAHILWGDADAEPRGWERQPRLAAPRYPRLALQNQALLMTPDGPMGFARPPGLGLVLPSLQQVLSGLTKL